MDFRGLRRLILAGLVGGGLVAPMTASTAQESAAADLGDTVVRELTIVAPGTGPAWWKVSKGDASVWIIGLPPKTPRGMKWDQTTLKRRLKGARLMLGAYIESSGFRPGSHLQTLHAPLASRVASEYRRLYGRPLKGEPTIQHAISLHWNYQSAIGISYDTHEEIYQAARRAGVKFVTPPVYTHTWTTREMNTRNPEMMRCLEATFREIHEAPELHYKAAEYWAVGDVVNMLAIQPKGSGRDCELLFRGHWERTVAFQTALIAQALDKPGKVVAAAHIDQLIARDGILERLRAQGFTIHDPSQPLEE